MGTRSINEQEESPGEEATTWMTIIRRFLQTGEVPEGEVEDPRIRRDTPNYQIIDGMLYKKK